MTMTKNKLFTMRGEISTQTVICMYYSIILDSFFLFFALIFNFLFVFLIFLCEILSYIMHGTVSHLPISSQSVPPTNSFPSFIN